MERLRGILPRILDEARRALNAELEILNRAGIAEKLKLARRSQPRIVVPDGGWQIRVLENTDDGIEPGDIAIYSELALPAKDDLGAGSMTKRITTRRLAGVESTAQSYQEGHQESRDKPGAARSAAGVPALTAYTSTATALPAPTPAVPEAPLAFAVIEY